MNRPPAFGRPRGPWTSAPLVALVVATAVGCNIFGLSGQGEMTTESRQVSDFTRVDASGGINVAVRMGPAISVEVSAQPNILPIIATDVQDGTLIIHSTQAYNTSEGVHVAITVPALVGVSLSGGSQGTAEALGGDHLDVSLSGGAGMTVSGALTGVTLEASGGSTANLDALQCETADVELSGGASARVRASDAVTGSASGGSHVTVLGGANVQVNTSGGASVSTE
jgi:Putative auto-transporter adhesin, head GIN domain